MGRPRPFIDRKQARHFHLVHRSQRDPLAADSEAPAMVLREYTPSNLRHGYPADEQEEDYFSEVSEDKSKVGEAAIYGIDYEDQLEYDYMQHLKEVGRSANAVLIEAPAVKSESKETRKGFQLPAETLPSREEIDKDLLQQDLLKEGTLELDPSVLEIMESLEDEAFIQDFDDGFLDQLHEESAAFSNEDDYSYVEDDAEFDNDDYPSETDEEYDDYKSTRRGRLAQVKEEELMSSFSMSSSSLYRNEGLTLLDERFDKVLQDYDEDAIGAIDDGEEQQENDRINGRFESVLDDFLATKKALYGRRLEEIGESGTQEVDNLRASLRELTLNYLNRPETAIQQSDSQEAILVPTWGKHHVEDRWDCETILETHTNTENRPRVISEKTARQREYALQGLLHDAKQKTHPSIALSHRTGLPLGLLKPLKSSAEAEDGSDEEKANLGEARKKEETAEEKKERKAAVKEEKRTRRAAKKATKVAFKQEQKRQHHHLIQNAIVVRPV